MGNRNPVSPRKKNWFTCVASLGSSSPEIQHQICIYHITSKELKLSTYSVVCWISHYILFPCLQTQSEMILQTWNTSVDSPKSKSNIHYANTHLTQYSMILQYLLECLFHHTWVHLHTHVQECFLSQLLSASSQASLSEYLVFDWWSFCIMKEASHLALTGYHFASVGYKL